MRLTLTHTLATMAFLLSCAPAGAQQGPDDLQTDQWFINCRGSENAGKLCSMQYLSTASKDSLEIVKEISGDSETLYINLPDDLPRKGGETEVAYVQVDKLAPHVCDAISKTQLVCGRGPKTEGYSDSDLLDEMLKGTDLLVHHAGKDHKAVDYTVTLKKPYGFITGFYFLHRHYLYEMSGH